MMNRTLTQRWWDIPAAFCLIMAVMGVASRLYATQWTTDLQRIQYLTFIGIVLGLALGQSRFSSGLVRLMAILYGIIFIPWQMTLMQNRDVSWLERLLSFFGRIGSSGNQFFRGSQVDDSILFIVLMAVLFWLLATTAGYALTRHGNAWAAIIPAGVAVIIINHYDPSQPSWGRIIGSYLFFSLLLLGRVTYLRYRAEWNERGVAQAPETGLDIGRAAVVAVVCIVILAWNVPALAASSDAARELWTTVSHPWESLRDRFSDAVSSLRSTVGVVSDFYGDELGLGTGTRLGDETVFTVEAESELPPGGRFYWRALSYDQYSTQDGWLSSGESELSFSPRDAEIIAYPDWDARQTVQLNFSSRISLMRTLYTGQNPIWVSRPGNLIYNAAPDGTLDLAKIEASPPLKAGEVYGVRSSISIPTRYDLRESGEDYPAWVTERYLQLPSDFSPRVRELAREIAAGADNPYDRVHAITQYLRQNISYNTSVPTRPEDTDPIEWFLFDIKEGYCNYYATSEVLMLRAIGIPARMAAGFAAGEINEEGNLYTVRQRDAHAWPEVYFAGFGWVEFEPTAAQPDRELPEGSPDGTDLDRESNALPDTLGGREPLDEELEDPLARMDALADEAAAARNQTRNRRLLLGAGGLTGLAAIFFGWRYARRRYRIPAFPIFLEQTMDTRGFEVPSWLRGWSHQTRLSPLQRSYQTLNQSLRILGKPAPRSATPAERADALAQSLPAANEPAQALVSEYQGELYANHPADLQLARQSGVQVRWMAIKAFFSRLFREP